MKRWPGRSQVGGAVSYRSCLILNIKERVTDGERDTYVMERRSLIRVAIISAIGYVMGFLRMRSCGVQSATALYMCSYASAWDSRRPIQRRTHRYDGVAGHKE
jgi:hypothetical protein